MRREGSCLKFHNSNPLRGTRVTSLCQVQKAFHTMESSYELRLGCREFWKTALFVRKERYLELTTITLSCDDTHTDARVFGIHLQDSSVCVAIFSNGSRCARVCGSSMMQQL